MSQADITPIVRIRGVSKNYGIFNAISDINLDIVPGEFITFLGPSGSGKTTTLMMLAGFETPGSGIIEMEGRRIEKLPAHKREIGVVFQNYALFPHMTVRENLAFPLKVRNVSRQEIASRVDAALAKVHLDGLAERKPAHLSGGQQQRVALARAIIFQPRLIVLDEPLAALDKNLREHLQTELKALHRDLGTTMVFVTHDQSEALTLSDRVAVFNKGRIEQIDSPSRLYEAPATPFVASFIGENNLLPATVLELHGHEVVVRLAGGAMLRAPATEGCQPGDPVVFSIRPENIGVADGSTQAIALAARVTDVVYLGEQHRIALDAEGIGRLVMKMNAAQGSHIGIGARLAIHMPISACRIIKEQ
jgi:putative spermidine/putrescine transport system ATP-binding protein